ncbi:MAG: GMC family oxidoreductase [Gemmatimonadetes bacterium]|nr:GMC family oxidoreductase [Gemmatimonadota bacterium]
MTGRVLGYREIAADVVEQCDVCVIGTGCGGATLGVRLAEAGKDVVFLERGGAYTKEDFDQREDNMLAKVDGGRGLDMSDDGSVQRLYGNNVGGASVHYWADSYRTPPDRLAHWAQEYGLTGHGEADLAPHFDALERDLSVHEAEPRYYNRMNQLLKLGAGRLGWRGAPVPQARKGCIGSGYCQQGCAYDAKQSQLVTHLPRAVAAGARVYADTEARALEMTGGKVSTLAAAVLDRGTGMPNGRSVRVQAKALVLAAGGYGSPVFLLRNGFKARLPAVGEHTYCNPCPMTHAIFDEEIVMFRNIPAAWGIDHFRLATMDGDRYAEGGYLLMANQLQPAELAAVLPGTGASHRALMTKLRKLGGAISWIDDVEEGSVSLDGDRARYQVPLGGGNELRIRDAFAKQARLLLTVGAKEVLFGDQRDTRITKVGEIERAVRSLAIAPGNFVFAAPHPAGGARMGADARTSVVGMDHRVHGTDNLFVADPSVFPTAPSVDPSLTIMAFACVAAAHVKASLA